LAYLLSKRGCPVKGGSAVQDTLGKVIDLVKVIVIFALLTLLFYIMIIWIDGYLDQQGKEQEPSGKSVQVMERVSEGPLENINDMTRRLVFFYWYGE
jgi:hypothetical protein